MVNKQNKKLDSLILLRGLAALFVVFCHLGGALKNAPGFFGTLFIFFHQYGIYGVDMFFVISGFVIPLSLDKSGYKLDNYGMFLKKRIYRLHPPYIIALVLTLVIGYASHYVNKIEYDEDVISVVKSFFYLHIPSDNPVFWTLGVEIVYYFFIGLAFVLFVNYPKISLFILTPLLLLETIFHFLDFISFFKYAATFLVGIYGYLVYSGNNRFINYTGLIGVCLFLFFAAPLPGFIISVLTVLFILYYDKTILKAFNFLGEVSYSVYLLHFIIGVKFINIASKHISPSLYWLLFFFTIVLVYICSYVFYLYVEVPFANISNKIKYKPKAAI